MKNNFVIDSEVLNYIKSIVQISPFVQFNENKKIRCMSGMDNTASVLGTNTSVFVEYDADIGFPFTFNIDGGQLIQLIDLLDKPVNVVVNEKNLLLGDDKANATIFFSNLVFKGQGGTRFGLQQWFDEKVPTLKFPNQFEIEFDKIQKLTRACYSIGCQTLSLVGRNGKLFFIADNRAVQSSDNFVIEVGKTKESFTHSIDVNDLKLFNQKYTVKYNDKVFLFEGEKVRYWILMYRK